MEETQEIFTCKICNEPFGSFSTLRQHSVKMHGRSLAPGLTGATCDICGYESSKGGVGLHKRLAHGIRGPQSFRDRREAAKTTFDCSYCDKTFNSRNALRTHKSRHHRNAPDIVDTRNSQHATVISTIKFCPHCGENLEAWRKV